MVSAVVVAGLMTACGGGDEAGSGTSGSSSSSAESRSSTTGGPSPSRSTVSGSPASVDLSEEQFPVTWQQALKTARSHADGKVGKIELEQGDSGRYAYKVEIRSATQKQAVHVDARSGKVLNTTKEKRDDDETGTRQETVDLDKAIPLSTAMRTATRERDGAVNTWKIEGKADERARYEFDIGTKGAGEDAEVQVDAYTGKVIRGDD